jgi:hypothetical protein
MNEYLASTIEPLIQGDAALSVSILDIVGLVPLLPADWVRIGIDAIPDGRNSAASLNWYIESQKNEALEAFHGAWFDYHESNYPMNGWGESEADPDDVEISRGYLRDAAALVLEAACNYFEDVASTSEKNRPFAFIFLLAGFTAERVLSWDDRDMNELFVLSYKGASKDKVAAAAVGLDLDIYRSLTS